MIVRIAGEGQWQLDEGHAQKIDELDEATHAAVEAHDREAFRARWSELLDLIESEGRRIPDDELVGSDVILPPRDVSLEEAERDLSGEDLIPG